MCTSSWFKCDTHTHTHTHTHTVCKLYLSWEQWECVVSLKSSEEGVLVGDQIARIVPMDGNPITATINDDVMWEGSVVNSPHVIITLNKSSVQTLFLNKPKWHCVCVNETRKWHYAHMWSAHIHKQVFIQRAESVNHMQLTTWIQGPFWICWALPFVYSNQPSKLPVCLLEAKFFSDHISSHSFQNHCVLGASPFHTYNTGNLINTVRATHVKHSHVILVISQEAFCLKQRGKFLKVSYYYVSSRSTYTHTCMYCSLVTGNISTIPVIP